MRLFRRCFLAPFMTVASALALVSCSSGPSTSPDKTAATPFVGHVHGLGVDPADRVLYVATHGGVFRLTGGRLELVADRAQDTMGFTVVGPNHFVASGHPAPTDLGRPIHLGLIESRDAAITWTELSLSGKADFHSLDQGVDGLYGYDSRSGTVMKSSDKKTWVPLMSGEVRDLATHPTLPNLVLVTTAKGVIRIAGRDQTALPSPTGLWFLEWPTPDLLVGVRSDGTVQQSFDAGSNWAQTGQIPGRVESFHAAGETWFAATDLGIYTSSDRGHDWTRLL